MHIMKTNYYSYAVGQSCTDFGESHDTNWFVWVREKQPSMYMRKQVRDYL